MHDLNTRRFQVADVDAVEPVDLLVLVGKQRRPVEGRLRQAPAETRRVFEAFGEMAGIDEEFLRHAAANDAGAADPVLLGHHHLGTELRSHARGTHTA